MEVTNAQNPPVKLDKVEREKESLRIINMFKQAIEDGINTERAVVKVTQ